jgi:hypothetical protein
MPSPAPRRGTPDADVARLVDQLVDAIDVRESCEPDVPHWDVGPLIRDLERRLAREWGATRRPMESGPISGSRP